MQTCFKKFGWAFKTLQEEKNTLFAALDDLDLRGEDKYAARGI
jgi:hypothetical protein